MPAGIDPAVPPSGPGCADCALRFDLGRRLRPSVAGSLSAGVAASLRAAPSSTARRWGRGIAPRCP